MNLNKINNPITENIKAPRQYAILPIALRIASKESHEKNKYGKILIMMVIVIAAKVSL